MTFVILFILNALPYNNEASLKFSLSKEKGRVSERL